MVHATRKESLMPRASKPESATPTGPRLVKKDTTTAGVPVITHEQIAARAYEIFEREGYSHGNHVDHWLKAERELLEDATARPKRAAASRARR
jgi:hypothetical protein